MKMIIVIKWGHDNYRTQKFQAQIGGKLAALNLIDPKIDTHANFF